MLHAALGGGGAQAALGAIADMRADKFVPNISLYNKVRKTARIGINGNSCSGLAAVNSS